MEGGQNTGGLKVGIIDLGQRPRQRAVRTHGELVAEQTLARREALLFAGDVARWGVLGDDLHGIGLRSHITPVRHVDMSVISMQVRMKLRASCSL